MIRNHDDNDIHEIPNCLFLLEKLYLICPNAFNARLYFNEYLYISALDNRLNFFKFFFELSGQKQNFFRPSPLSEYYLVNPVFKKLIKDKTGSDEEHQTCCKIPTFLGVSKFTFLCKTHYDIVVSNKELFEIGDDEYGREISFLKIFKDFSSWIQIRFDNFSILKYLFEKEMEPVKVSQSGEKTTENLCVYIFGKQRCLSEYVYRFLLGKSIRYKNFKFFKFLFEKKKFLFYYKVIGNIFEVDFLLKEVLGLCIMYNAIKILKYIVNQYLKDEIPGLLVIPDSSCNFAINSNARDVLEYLFELRKRNMDRTITKNIDFLCFKELSKGVFDDQATFEHATKFGSMEIFEFFFKMLDEKILFFHPFSKTFNVFRKVIEYCDITKVKFLFIKFPEQFVNSICETDEILRLCASEHRFHILKFIIEKSEKYKELDLSLFGNCLLEETVIYGNHKLCLFLISPSIVKRYPSIDPSFEDNSLLKKAARGGCSKIVEILLRKSTRRRFPNIKPESIRLQLLKNARSRFSETENVEGDPTINFIQDYFRNFDLVNDKKNSK